MTKHIFQVYFWYKSRIKGQVKWIVKYKKKIYKVDIVKIDIPCSTRARNTNPRGIITGKCSHISFQTIKRNGYKLTKAVIT